MRIGFDAKRAFQNNTGLGHYSRTLINSLAHFYPDNEYFLFAPKITDRFKVAGRQHNTHVITPGSFPATAFPAAWRSSWVTSDLTKLQIDLYHGLSHEIPVGIQKMSIPSVVTIHDLIFERFPSQHRSIDRMIYRKKFKYAAQNADAVIAISRQTREDLIRLYNIPEGKIEVCYQACDPIFERTLSLAEREAVLAKYDLPPQYFLYVGSIIERKNLLSICKCLKKLEGKLSIPLVVIGDGSAYKLLVKQYIKEHGLERSVIFLSENEYAKHSAEFKSSADFPAIYQGATALVYPSLFEGFGIPILEALWSRTPVIASNSSCMPETGGDAALYTDPYDADLIASHLFQVATTPALAASMATKGWQHAQNFTQQKTAAAVMNVYHNIVR